MTALRNRFAISFCETMRGQYLPRGEQEERPFHFTIHAHPAENPRDDWEITGTVHLPGLADHRPLLGRLSMSRNELRYQFRFIDNSGSVHHFTGSKYPDRRQFLRSRTHMDHAHFRREEEPEPWATARAVFRGPWIPFFLSFRISTRRRRPAGKRTTRQQREAAVRPLKHRELALALAEAAFPGSERIAPADAAVVARLEQWLRSNAWMRGAYDSLLWLLPWVAGRPAFARDSLAQRRETLARLHKSGFFFSRLLLRGLVMPMKALYMASTEQHERLGCKYGKDPVAPGPAETWMRRIHPASEFEGDELVDADVVVVGTGAGGAVAAKELAEKGLAVVLIESGPFLRRESFTGRAAEMLPRLYRNYGLSFTIGRPIIPLPTGNVVGGTTLINSGTCFRTPEEVLLKWVAAGLTDFTPERMAPYFERVESIIKVTPAEKKVIGPIGEIIGRGADALGYSHGPLPRYAPDCLGEGVCQLGCPSDAKQSTNLSYIPAALKSQAVLFPEFKVRDILTNGQAAVGVRAFGRGKEGKTVCLTVLARAVVLAAGTLLTPVLLQRNGLARGNRWIGANLSIHPAGGASAFFPGMDMRNGSTIPQGYCVDHFKKEGILFEGGTLTLEAYAVTGPLMGAEYIAHLERFQETAFFGFMIEDEARGRVRPGVGDRPLILYSMTRNDVRRFVRAMAILGRIFLAAGAEWVLLGGVRGSLVKSDRDIEEFLAREHKIGEFVVSAFHPLGTARIGVDERSSAADPAHQLHKVPRLFVVDGSAVPSSVGVNPMVTIMALATRAAERIADILS